MSDNGAFVKLCDAIVKAIAENQAGLPTVDGTKAGAYDIQLKDGSEVAFTIIRRKTGHAGISRKTKEKRKI